MNCQTPIFEIIIKPPYSTIRSGSKTRIDVVILNKMGHQVTFVPSLELEVEGRLLQVVVLEAKTVDSGERVELSYELQVPRGVAGKGLIRVVLSNHLETNIEKTASIMVQ